MKELKILIRLRLRARRRMELGEADRSLHRRGMVISRANN